ncbi:A24 family peptidase [Streptomyces daliensis]
MLLTLTLAGCAAAYGALAGALLPRAAYRLAVEPGEPWRAACPEGHPLDGPARGWLGRARCARCDHRTRTPQAQPAARAPYARGALCHPVACAAVCASFAAAVGVRPELAVWLLAAPFALLLAVVDRRVRRLPDVLTLPLAAGTAALLGVAALLPGAGGSWLRALLGGAVLAAVYFVLFLINPRGMGFGDVKLAIALGVALGWYGWDVVFAGTFLGFLLAALYGLALMAARRAGRKTAMPFGPFMVTGALGGLLLGALAA